MHPLRLGQEVEIPHFFRCPISLDLMSDPVTLPTGQTYDRLGIEKWLVDGNHTCPVTQQPLSTNDGDGVLIPNHTLRRLIQGWCIANQSIIHDCMPTPITPIANPEDIANLITSLLAVSDSSKVGPLKCMRELARSNQQNRKLILDSAAIPALIRVAFDSDMQQCGAEVREDALETLVFLGPTSSDLAAMHHDQRLRELSQYLKQHHRLKVRMEAASLIDILASAEHNQVNVVATEGIIEGLVALIHWDTSFFPCSAIKVGLQALFASCLLTCNRERAVLAGATKVLIECLFSWPWLDLRDTERALATLELLCKTTKGRQAVEGHALTVPVMKKNVFRVSENASEKATSILAAICENSEKLQEEALADGIFTQLLFLLQSKSSFRAKKKARFLLKLLKDKWPNHYCIQAASRINNVSAF